MDNAPLPLILCDGLCSMCGCHFDTEDHAEDCPERHICTYSVPSADDQGDPRCTKCGALKPGVSDD